MLQYHASILIDGAATSQINGSTFTPDPTQAQHFETQVAGVLNIIKDTIAGQVLLREVMRGGLGKAVRIIPFPNRDARSLPSSEQDATPYNKPLRYPGDLPNTPQKEQAGQIVLDNKNKPILGTGYGANVTIQYHPMMWLMDSLKTGKVGNLMPDDVLVHELLHALRMMNGLISTMDLGDPNHSTLFGNTEEFYALLVANIYVSERNGKEGRGQPLRGNISTPEKFQPLVGVKADSKTFYTTHKSVIETLCMDMIGLCHGGGFKGLMHSPAGFNPIRDCEEEKEALRMKYYGGLGLPDFPASR